MYKLQVLFPVWIIDYHTYHGKGHDVMMTYEPFDTEEQARSFWLNMKDKLKRNYDIAIITDKMDNECYIDERECRSIG